MILMKNLQLKEITKLELKSKPILELAFKKVKTKFNKLTHISKLNYKASQLENNN